MTTETPRARWVRAELKVIDVEAGKVAGQYNDAVLSEQTIVLPLMGQHGAVIALEELGQALRTMIAQSVRIHPLRRPEAEVEAESEATPVADLATPVASSSGVADDVDDIPF